MKEREIEETLGKTFLVEPVCVKGQEGDAVDHADNTDRTVDNVAGDHAGDDVAGTGNPVTADATADYEVVANVGTGNPVSADNTNTVADPAAMVNVAADAQSTPNTGHNAVEVPDNTWSLETVGNLHQGCGSASLSCRLG